MPTINSQADIAQYWTGLLEAADRNPELLPSVSAEVEALRKSLADLQSLKARQLDLGSARQQTTQELKKVIEQGRDLAIQICAMAKGRLGPRNERLVHFNVAPIRRRPRKPVVVVKPDGETPASGPDASPARPVA